MKTGMWNIEVILEGVAVSPWELSGTTLEHIAEQIKDGFNGGEIIEED